jgi:hypothetical protein
MHMEEPIHESVVLPDVPLSLHLRTFHTVSYVGSSVCPSDEFQV